MEESIMFEYVDKDEYSPVRSELEDIIKSVQDELRGEITFKFDLIGSGSNKLITKVKGGNQGFDFDYNIVLQKGADFTAKEIRDKFMNAFRKALKGTRYSDPSASKPAIIIKVVDQENSRIIHSCDFGIVRESYDQHNEIYHEINIFDKPNARYIWNIRAKSTNYADRAKEIKRDGLWGNLRAEYLKLKNNNNDEDKISYQLYLEAINNIYNQNY